MEKIKYYLFCISVFAIVFLVADIPIASAANINLITAGQKETLKLELSKFVKKAIDIHSGNVKINISNAGNYSVESALLYLCKDKNPLDCLNSSPIEYRNKVDTILKLDQIENNSKAGLLSIVKVNQSWLSFWDYIENGIIQNTDLDEVNVYSSVNINDTKGFIETYGMIPFSFLDKVDFKGKKIYQATGVASRSIARSDNITLTNKKIVATIEKDAGYIFAFPFDGKTFSPMTFYNAPSSCGNGRCDIGENYQTCWYDCACPAGQSPSRNGCVNQSSVKLMIDEIESTPVECVVPGGSIEPGKNTSCQPAPFTVKYHIENAPVNYTLFPASHYFGMNSIPGKNATYYVPSCLPKSLASSRLTGSYSSRVVTNASEYECIITQPKLYGIQGNSDVRSLLIGAYMDVHTQNGTETIQMSNLTNVPFNILGVDLTGLEKLKRKIEKNKRWMDILNEITLTIAWISFIFTAITATAFACWVIGLATSWIPGVGSTLITTCGPLIPSFGKWALITTVIFLVLGALILLCQGQAVPAPFIGIPATPKWMSHPAFFGIKYKGESVDLVSEGASKKVSEVMRKLGAALGNPLPFLAPMAEWCGKAKKNEDRLKQKIEEAEQQKKSQLQEAVTNLIWVKGNATGRTSTICGNENVKGFYNFQLLDCSGGLWFSLNGRQRPTCNFTSSTWGNQKDNIFGDSCNPANTTEYNWILQNSSGENLGIRTYNTTVAGKLFDRPASSLFTPAVNGSHMNVFVSCDSQAIGEKIEDEFKLANYTDVCP